MDNDYIGLSPGYRKIKNFSALIRKIKNFSALIRKIKNFGALIRKSRTLVLLIRKSRTLQRRGGPGVAVITYRINLDLIRTHLPLGISVKTCLSPGDQNYSNLYL